MVKLNEEQNKAAEEKYDKAVMAYERKVSDLNKEKEEQEKRQAEMQQFQINK